MKSKAGITCIAIGVVLIVLALALLLYNKMESQRAEEAAIEALDKLEAVMETYEPDPDYKIPDFVLGNTETEEPEEEDSSDSTVTESDTATAAYMPTITIDGYDYIGTIEVPALGLQLPVMAEWSYSGLNIAPGCYSGTIWTNDLVICGHNYDRHFGQLRNLSVGDTVIFTDVMEDVFTFEITETETLQPAQVSEMIGDDDAHDWDLTLFTCTVGGQTRLALRCELQDMELS